MLPISLTGRECQSWTPTLFEPSLGKEAKVKNKKAVHTSHLF